MQPESVNIRVSSTPPLAAATLVIFDSTVSTPGFLRSIGADRLSVVIENDQTATLKLYWSSDRGVTWRQVEGDEAVTVPAADDSSGPFDFAISTYEDVKLELLNGGTNQGSGWNASAALHCNDRAAQT